MTYANLVKLYEVRLNGYKIDKEEDLENLLITDEKTFYFALMYFYLTKKDLGSMIRTNVILSNSVTLFCLSCDDSSINKYYAQYTNLREVPEQIIKIHNELDKLSLKDQLNRWNLPNV